MHVLVFGATGVVGRRLLPRLRAAGHRVTAVTRRAAAVPDLEALGAEARVADALDGRAVAALLATTRPDAVIQQLTDLREGRFAANNRIRREGTAHIVAAMAAAGVPRLVAQSFALYAPGPGLADEAAPLDHASGIYGNAIEGIAALESSVREAREGVVLRFGSLYGPDTWFAPDGWLAQEARAGRLPATDDVTSFLHAEDAAAATVAALTWAPGAYNVAEADAATGRAWVPRFAAAVGAPTPAVVQVAPAERRRGLAVARSAAAGWTAVHRWTEAWPTEGGRRPATVAVRT